LQAGQNILVHILWSKIDRVIRALKVPILGKKKRFGFAIFRRFRRFISGFRL
jgi:hypothetical protein